MLPTQVESYEVLYQGFRWTVPPRYNIGVDACAKWAEQDESRLALIFIGPDGRSVDYTFGAIHEASNRLGRLLHAQGVNRGDRVAVLLPQSPYTAIAHIAAYKIGVIAIPLFTLFGAEALKYRLSDSGARVVITNAEGAVKLAELRAVLPDLQAVFSIDGPGPDVHDLVAEMDRHPTDLDIVDTAADDPAVIIYTSGTTGQPKGALHAHRVLLGHLPGVEMSHSLFPAPDDRMWTPADWAWIGGLYDVLFPAWHHGIPVVAHRFQKFTPEAAFQLLQDFKIRNTFLPPTALKLMRAVVDPHHRWNYELRSVASGGESLGAELLDWGRRVFGLTINEFYGQTECNMTVSSCAPLFAPRPGAIGKAVPGHDVQIIDDHGDILPSGQSGHIAVRAPDPVSFLGYWNNPDATRSKYIGAWLVTGDMGMRDDEGFIHFIGRNDDVITSAGYRIGPGEIEDCLLQHESVEMVAVVGVPDAERSEAVTAFVVLRDRSSASDALKKALQAHVKSRLAAHEYPRHLYFVDELPMTTTGKVIRRDLREWALTFQRKGEQ